jgi:hypothetical protein
MRDTQNPATRSRATFEARRLRMAILIMGLLALLLAACGSPTPAATPTTPATPDIANTPYPAPALPVTPVPEAESGYPPPLPTPQLPSGYPANSTWLVRPAGIQCETPEYPDLEAAVAALADAGVTVQSAETISLPVCLACGCPTSEHYRVLIAPADVGAALALDWIQE